jgi:hypothetical protein
MRKLLVIAALTLVVAVFAVVAYQLAPVAEATDVAAPAAAPQAPLATAGGGGSCYVSLACSGGGYRSCSGSSSCTANVGAGTVSCDGQQYASCPQT